jgi:hypothetical protein
MTTLKFGDPASIAAAAAARPIEQMYASFGKKRGKQCGDCAHHGGLIENNRCGIYARTHTDKPFPFDTPACGKWEK